MRQSSQNLIVYGSHSRSQSNFFGMNGGMNDTNQQTIDLSSQEGQDTIQMLAESKIDCDSIDESRINDEKTKNIVHAIKLRKQKMVLHSDFYYLLDKVSDRIYMYKSLFLDKRPKYMKGPALNRVNSSEIKQARLKAKEDDKRAKLLQTQRVKKKKNQFYDNLAKKPQKSIKISTTMVRRGQLMDQMMFSSNGGGSIISINMQSNPELENLQQEHAKEIQRKERLYSQKPKGAFQQRNSSTDNNQNDISKERQQLELKQQPTDITTSVRNDITYLSQMKNSLSLPYLNHIKIKDEAPLAIYLQQKSKEKDSKIEIDIEKAKRKKKKLLILAERNFLKLNQKSQITQNIQSFGSIITRNQRIPTIQFQRQGDGTERIYNRVISLPSLPKTTQAPDIQSLNQIRDIIQRQNSNAKKSNPILVQLKPRDDINDYYMKSARNGGNQNKILLDQSHKKLINQ